MGTDVLAYHIHRRGQRLASKSGMYGFEHGQFAGEEGEVVNQMIRCHLECRSNQRVHAELSHTEADGFPAVVQHDIKFSVTLTSMSGMNLGSRHSKFVWTMFRCALA